MIDTDFARNIQHIRPYLGVLLVGAIALGLGLMINSAAKQLTQSIHTDVPAGIEGKLSLKTRGDLYYGDVISYKSRISGISLDQSNTYVTTVCFQKDRMVYQKSAQQGVSVYLNDQLGPEFEWDGLSASCSATLMYRVAKPDAVNVYIVDSLSFEVSSK